MSGGRVVEGGVETQRRYDTDFGKLLVRHIYISVYTHHLSHRKLIKCCLCVFWSRVI